MGAIQSSSAIYLTISDGKICRRVTSPTETSVQRTTKDNRIVNEEFYRGWSGKIVAVNTRESEYGKDWQIHFKDENGLAILSMKYSSGYAAAFLKALPNVDLSKNVQLSPKVTVEGEKKKTTIFLNQDGAPVKWFYTKDNPNGCPGLKKIKVKGVETWDDSDMMEFLERMVFDRFNDIEAEDSAPF